MRILHLPNLYTTNILQLSFLAHLLFLVYRMMISLKEREKEVKLLSSPLLLLSELSTNNFLVDRMIVHEEKRG